MTKFLLRWIVIQRRRRDTLKAYEALEQLVDDYPEFKLTFSISYSSIIDFHVDITPARNHPRARQYPCFEYQAMSFAAAVWGAIELAKNDLDERCDDGDAIHQ